jgi:nitroreductase
MAAPSAKNHQPWEFYAVTNREVIEQLSQVGTFSIHAKTAPLVIVPCWQVERDLMEGYSYLDLSAATENLLLEAVNQELGAVWLAVFPRQERMDKVREILNIPESLKPFAIIRVGYAAEDREWKDRWNPEKVHFVP